MKRKDLYRIINEEVGEFDFLGIEQENIDVDKHNLVHSRDFQIQFVSDVIRDFNNKEKFSYNFVYDSKKTDNMLNQFDMEGLNIAFDIDIDYNFQNEIMGIVIIVEGVNIDIEDTEHLDDWGNNFKIKFFDDNGAVIKFDWLLENDEIYQQFIETLIAEHNPNE